MQQFRSLASSATWWNTPGWQRAASHGIFQQHLELSAADRLQRAALQLPPPVQFILEKRSVTKPMLLQTEETLNPDSVAHETKQLQTPKCQKLSQQFMTFMKTS